MSTRNTTQAAIEDVVDVVGDSIGGITDDLGEIAEVAVTAIAETSVVGVRLLTRTIRFITRHPREVLAGVAVIAVAVGVMSVLKSRSDASSTQTA